MTSSPPTDIENGTQPLQINFTGIALNTCVLYMTVIGAHQKFPIGGHGETQDVVGVSRVRVLCPLPPALDRVKSPPPHRIP